MIVKYYQILALENKMVCWSYSIIKQIRRQHFIPEPLYNTVCNKTGLDIIRISAGP